MKKNYFLWTVCMALLSGYGLPQNTYVTGPAKVKVNPQTLVFFGDNLTITENASDEANVDNAGNIVVVGDYSNAHASSNASNFDAGKNFLNRYISDAVYGQLIVNDVKNAGFVGIEKLAINPANTDWGQFAIPFDYADAQEATQRLFGLNYFNSGDRYRNSMMVWNNLDKPQFDHLNNASQITPGQYVILNLTYSSPGILGLMQGGGNLQHFGKALNKPISVSFDRAYYPTEDWDEWKEHKNDYNERYKTYISDPLRDMNNDPDYGKYMYQFGNPYSSNITLAFIGLPEDGTNDDGNYFDDLRGVAQGDKVTWNMSSGSYNQTMIKATYDSSSKTWAGDADALIVQPFNPFIVIFNGDQGDNEFHFSDKLKTFSFFPTADLPVYTKKELPTTGWDTDMETDVTDRNMSATLGTANSMRSKFYQAKFSLYDEDGNPTGNRFFMVVSGNVKNGKPNDLEAEYNDFGDRTGFFLDQENVNGKPVQQAKRKMHINTIHLSYTNKPIPLFFNRERGDLNGYYLKADLFYGSIFNQLSMETNNFADGNSFFFYDRSKDVLLPVTTDFMYHVRPSQIQLSGSPYELYWNGGATTTKEALDGELEMLTEGSTIIYKDRDTHVVKFNSQWSSADVKVYDINGRNVLTHENADASNLLSLQLPVRGVYVVMITADTGEIYTQKIIK